MVTSEVFESLILGLDGGCPHCHCPEFRNSGYSVPASLDIVLKGAGNKLQLLIVDEI